VGKTRKSVTIDDDLAELIDQRDDLNFSAFVNELTRDYFTSGESTDRALELKLQHIEREIEETKEELDRLRNERNRIEELIEERRDRQEPVVEELRRIADQSPTFDLHEDNDAVQQKAAKAGMTPSELVERVREAKGDGSA